MSTLHCPHCGRTKETDYALCSSCREDSRNILTGCQPLQLGDVCRTTEGHPARYLKDGVALRRKQTGEPCPCFRYGEAVPARGDEARETLPGDVAVKVGLDALGQEPNGVCLSEALTIMDVLSLREGMIPVVVDGIPSLTSVSPQPTPPAPPVEIPPVPPIAERPRSTFLERLHWAATWLLTGEWRGS